MLHDLKVAYCDAELSFHHSPQGVVTDSRRIEDMSNESNKPSHSCALAKHWGIVLLSRGIHSLLQHGSSADQVFFHLQHSGLKSEAV